jgi:predicted PurR-regulated permease PerM
MADNLLVKRGIAGALIAGILLLTFFVLKPIILAIIFGLLFAYLFNPVYIKLKKYIPGQNVPALILIIGIILIVFIPLYYFLPLLYNQVFELFVLSRTFDFAGFFAKFFEPLLAGQIAQKVTSLISTIVSSFLGQLQFVPKIILDGFLQLAVFFFTFFFAMRDSEKLKDYLSTLSPFSKSTEDKFQKEFRGITNAIVFGQVLIGIIQGLAVGIGLFFLGVPNALFLTFLACIVSIIPVLGSWLVWLPVAGLLLVTGQTFAGIFMLLYGALFVASIDNLLRPYFLAKRSNLPVALGVIGTVGGLYLFGIAGLVLGPLILAYVLIIIEFYQQGKLNELFRK